MIPLPGRELFANGKLETTLQRLSYQLVEHHEDFLQSCLIGIQPRGVFLARRLYLSLQKLGYHLPYGELDVTFHRDDFKRRNQLLPNSTRIEFIIEEMKVILVDDVLYTGRTVRAAMDAMLSFGRPAKIELLVLVDRKRKRDLPITADYIGIPVDTLDSEHVIVQWKETHGNDLVRIEAHDK